MDEGLHQGRGSLERIPEVRTGDCRDVTHSVERLFTFSTDFPVLVPDLLGFFGVFPIQLSQFFPDFLQRVKFYNSENPQGRAIAKARRAWLTSQHSFSASRVSAASLARASSASFVADAKVSHADRLSVHVCLLAVSVSNSVDFKDVICGPNWNRKRDSRHTATT